jgi:NAD kinase
VIGRYLQVYDNVKRSYDAHRLARENITNSLARFGIDVNVVKAGKVLPSDLAGVDIIFAAGGDGTFLRAAQAVVGDIPVLGVNTDPSLSQGALTCCKLDLTGGRHPEFDRIIRRVQEGDYRTMYHDRLVVKIVNAEGQETILPQFVLNEVLLTVTDPAKPTVLDIGIDDFEREKIRCSGMVVW